MMFFQRSHINQSRLSAFVDERLPAGARDRVAQHLDACAACRSAEQDLRALRSALRSLPEVRAPRSFALREADVRAAPAPRPLLVQAVPMLSGLTALALFAFVALLSIDLFAGSSSNTSVKITAGEAAYQDRSAGAPQPSVPTSGLGAGAEPAAADTYTEQSGGTAVFETEPSATSALGAIERFTATVGVEATPAGPATPPVPSGAPPVSSLNSPTAGTGETDAFAPTVMTPTPTPQQTPLLPTRPALKEATATAADRPAAATNLTREPVATTTIRPTLQPELTPVSKPASSGSSDGTALRTAEVALAAVAVVSGGGLFVAWRRRS